MTAVHEDADVEIDSLAVALGREHHEIDAGIAAFTASPGNPQPLTRAIRALRRHIYLEEEFLFPRADRALPAAAASRLRAFLSSAQLPDGWVCMMKAPRMPRDHGNAGR